MPMTRSTANSTATTQLAPVSASSRTPRFQLRRSWRLSQSRQSQPPPRTPSVPPATSSSSSPTPEPVPAQAVRTVRWPAAPLAIASSSRVLRSHSRMVVRLPWRNCSQTSIVQTLQEEGTGPSSTAVEVASNSASEPRRLRSSFKAPILDVTREDDSSSTASTSPAPPTLPATSSSHTAIGTHAMRTRSMDLMQAREITSFGSLSVSATAVTSNPNEPDDCLICKEDHVSAESPDAKIPTLKVPCCNQSFHLDCLFLWRIRNPTCPHCRTEVARKIGASEATQTRLSNQFTQALEGNEIESFCDDDDGYIGDDFYEGDMYDDGYEDDDYHDYDPPEFDTYLDDDFWEYAVNTLLHSEEVFEEADLALHYEEDYDDYDNYDGSEWY